MVTTKRYVLVLFSLLVSVYAMNYASLQAKMPAGPLPITGYQVADDADNPDDQQDVQNPPGLYFLEITKPKDASFTRYARYTYFHRLSGTTTIEAWLFTSGGMAIPCYPKNTCATNRSLNPWPIVWLTIDGQRVTRPIYGPPYSTTLDTTQFPDGDHVIGADIASEDGSKFIVVPAVVTIDNIPGPVTGTQRIWKCRTKFDMTFKSYMTFKDVCNYVTYPGSQPSMPGDPFPNPRESVPFSTSVSSRDLWVEEISTGGYRSQFFEAPGGHVTTASRQKYFNSDINEIKYPIMDGPRGVATVGSLVGGIVANDGSLYAVATNGQLVKIWLSGTTETITGKRLKAGVLPPYWKSDDRNTFGTAGKVFFDSHYESAGIFVDGPDFLFEPWDIEVDPRYPARNILYVTDTLNHRVVKVDTSTNPATVTTYAGSINASKGYRDGTGTEALFNEPWGLAIDQQGNLYVTDRLNHALRKIDTNRRVTTIFKSSIFPEPSGVSVSERKPSTLGLTVSQRHSQYMRNGSFSQATLIYPEGLEFDSQGRLVVSENFLMTLRRIDLSAGTIDYIAAVPYASSSNTKNININVDAKGECGPVDDILVATWGQGGPWRLSADGTNKGAIFRNRLSVEYQNGRADGLNPIGYPWLAVCGNGAIWAAGGSSESVYRATLARQTDPVMSTADQTRYKNGAERHFSGTVPNFPTRLPIIQSARFGIQGPRIETLSDSQLAELIQSGFGNEPRPEVTGKDLDDYIFYLRWNCELCLQAGITRPAPQADTTPPAVSSISVSQITDTSAKVTWTTNEPAIGFVSFGRSPAHGRVSAVEEGYGTSHEMVLTDLFPGRTYYFAVRAKDVAGNQALATGTAFTTPGSGVADTTPPSLFFTSPQNMSTVSGVVTVSATASDNVQVIGVQFRLDGANLGSEDIASPYAVSWDTARTSPGVHTLSAAARDAAGNTATTSIAVTVAAPVQAPNLSAVRSGDWSSPGTWNANRVPAPADDVTISGFTVIYDMPLNNDTRAEAKTITVKGGGVLRFSRTKSTQLDLDGSLMILDGGYLDAGKPGDTIPAGVTARIGFNVPDDRLFTGNIPALEVQDFNEGDIGLWVMGSARADFHGAPKAAVWTKLAQDAAAGSSVLVVKDAPSGWRAGDRILITPTDNDYNKIEMRTITAINGNRITVDRPLSFAHKGSLHAYNKTANTTRLLAGASELKAGEILVAEQGEVALLTQNVVVMSNLVREGDVNHRAHTVFMDGADGSVAYTEFRDLGPRGKKGRYPVHLHVIGNRPSFVIRGVSVWTSVSTPGNKCIVIHTTNSVLVQDNVGYNVQGACFYLEEANEINNVLERNLGVLVHSPEELPNAAVAAQFGIDPVSSTVYWVREKNTFRNNVAVAGKGSAGFWPTPNMNSAGGATVFDYNEAHSNDEGIHYSDSRLSLTARNLSVWQNRIGLTSGGTTVSTVTSDSVFWDNNMHMFLPQPGSLIGNVFLSLVQGGVAGATGPGDVNGDGTVGLQDVLLVVQDFGKTSGFSRKADVTGDNVINIFDIMIIIANWGKVY